MNLQEVLKAQLSILGLYGVTCTALWQLPFVDPKLTFSIGC